MNGHRFCPSRRIKTVCDTHGKLNGWVQSLKQVYHEDTKWIEQIEVGNSSRNTEEIYICKINMEISPYPLNSRTLGTPDKLKTNIDSDWLSVTRNDAIVGLDMHLTPYENGNATNNSNLLLQRQIRSYI